MKADGTTMMQSDVIYPIECHAIDGVHHFTIGGTHRSRAIADAFKYANAGKAQLAARMLELAMRSHGCAIRDNETDLGQGVN
jgi:hypothetical protein